MENKFKVILEETGIKVIETLKLGDIEGEPKEHTSEIVFKNSGEFNEFKELRTTMLTEKQSELKIELARVKKNLANLDSLMLD